MGFHFREIIYLLWAKGCIYESCSGQRGCNASPPCLTASMLSPSVALYDMWLKKFLAPSASDYQGMKIWSLLFNIIPLQGNALSPSLFELAYPFQIEVFFPGPPSTPSLPLWRLHCFQTVFHEGKLDQSNILLFDKELTTLTKVRLRKLCGKG